jgi:hypothetical protein
LDALSHVVSWAKTCAKVTHIVSLAHMWKGESNGGEQRLQWWPDTGPDAVTDWPDASDQCSASAHVDQTRNASGQSRPDAFGRWGGLLDSNRTLALWRPVSSAARSVTVLLEHSLCLTSASGRSQRVRSTQRARPVGALRRSRCEIGAFSQCDQRVRSMRPRRFQVSNGSIRRGTYINTRWPAQSSLSCILWHTCEHFEPSNSPPTHLSCFFPYSKWDWVIQVHLHCEIASSWHLVVDLLWDFCFSRWLPPPRWLGAAWRRWQELVIVLGHLQWLWGVVPTSAKRQRQC